MHENDFVYFVENGTVFVGRILFRYDRDVSVEFYTSENILSVDVFDIDELNPVPTSFGLTQLPTYGADEFDVLLTI